MKPTTRLLFAAIAKAEHLARKRGFERLEDAVSAYRAMQQVKKKKP